MNKKAASVVIALVLLLASFPVIAYAIDSQSIDVTFTLTEEALQPGGSEDSGDGSSSDEEPSGTYSIFIPSSLPLNYEQDFFISGMSFLDVPATAQVIVSVDGARTFPDGQFYLTSGDGETDAQRMACNIQRGHAEDTSAPMETLTGPDDAVVAILDSSGHRTSYGWVKLQPLYSLDNVVGEYAGTVHFKIALVWE